MATCQFNPIPKHINYCRHWRTNVYDGGANAFTPPTQSKDVLIVKVNDSVPALGFLTFISLAALRPHKRLSCCLLRSRAAVLQQEGTSSSRLTSAPSANHFTHGPWPHMPGRWAGAVKRQKSVLKTHSGTPENIWTLGHSQRTHFYISLPCCSIVFLCKHMLDGHV